MTDNHNEILLNSTLSWCSTCEKTELTRIVATGKGVFMQRMCPVSMPQPVKIAADYKWYMDRMQDAQKVNDSDCTKKAKEGCPKDCGLCEWHTSSIKLPVFSITNDCNLNCPICFTYNRPDLKYYKTKEEAKQILHHVFSKKEKRQVVNLTGGEPTLHPNLFEILQLCHDTGIERITMNTNGLKIAADMDFARRIKDAGVQLVLSLDTLDPEKSIKIHGKDICNQKLKTLDILEKLDIPATILTVCIKGVNEEDVAEITSTYIKKDFVKSVTIQNMTFTGKNGSLFEPREHITIDEVEDLLVKKKDFAKEDFFPLASYHPLCYSVGYYIVHNNRLISLSSIFDKKVLRSNTENLYYMEHDSNMVKDFINGVSELWAKGYDDDIISDLKNFIKDVYPTGGNEISVEKRNAILEKKIKSVYIHPHMDEDNFDVDRVSRCGDIVPDENGRMVPACSYNLLYRQQDKRFWV